MIHSNSHENEQKFLLTQNYHRTVKKLVRKKYIQAKKNVKNSIKIISKK